MTEKYPGETLSGMQQLDLKCVGCWLTWVFGYLTGLKDWLHGCAEITCSELLLPWAVFFKQLLLWASPLFVLSRYFFSLTLPLSELHLSANSPLHLWASSLSFPIFYFSEVFSEATFLYLSEHLLLAIFPGLFFFRWARWRTSSLTSSSLSNFLSVQLADWVPEFHSSRRTC